MHATFANINDVLPRVPWNRSQLIDPFEPTIVFDSETVEHSEATGSMDVSRAQVGVVGGGQPKFADETRALLCRRLTAAAILISSVLGIAFLANLLRGVTELWPLRAALFVALVLSACVLRRVSSLTMRQLRLLEFAIFGALVVQVGMMMAT